jgi:hypothetical protein
MKARGWVNLPSLQPRNHPGQQIALSDARGSVHSHCMIAAAREAPSRPFSKDYATVTCIG